MTHDTGRPQIIEAVVQAVAELPDRTSPDDWPEAMLVTGDELRAILSDLLAESRAETQQDHLHHRIMNIPCAPKGYGDQAPHGAAFYKGYQFGHRDARHAAAELAVSASLVQEGASQPTDLPEIEPRSAELDKLSMIGRIHTRIAWLAERSAAIKSHPKVTRVAREEAQTRWTIYMLALEIIGEEERREEGLA